MRKYILSFSLIIAGCTTAHYSADQLYLAQNPFDRIGDRPDVLLTGLVEGRLEASETGCVGIRQGGRLLTVLWPEGTRIVDSASGPWVELPEGRGRALLGHQAALTGSAVGDPASIPVNSTDRERCPQDYVVASAIQ